MNHYSYGAVSGWLLSGVCGINVEGTSVFLKPYPHELLSFAKAEYDSPLGRIASAWTYEDDELIFSFDIPANVEASYELPDGQTGILSGGKHEFRIKI